MSRDYARIAQKIVDSNWLITESGLALIMEIFERRLAGEGLSDEQVAKLLNGESDHGADADRPYTVNSGIATLGIYGPIFGKANLMTMMSGATSLEAFRKDFAQALADSSVKSILLDIDSPGGTSDMVMETGDEIFAARDIKPIYSLANSDAGSAAFWLATQADKFYVAPSGDVGSVGAYTVHKDQSVRDANEGVRYTFVSAGKYKIEGNPHQPISRDAIDYRQEVINELYDGFVENVARGRGTTTEKVEANYGQGRMVPAKKAVIAGMVDGIREYDALFASLAETNNKPQTVNVVIPGYGGVPQAAEFGPGGVYHLSNADMEHSEPGTGSPPAPKLREDKDVAIESGSRRGDLPTGFPNENEPPNPGAPRAMADENNVLSQLCSILGFNLDAEQLNDPQAVERVVSKVTEMKATTDALRSDAERANTFAHQFPEEYARMERQDKRIRDSDAEAFVASVSRFTRQVGESTEKTTFGLSSLAKEGVRENHIKVATGQFTLSDYEGLIKSMTSGIVDFGDSGSTRVNENDDIDFTANDVSTPNQAKQLRDAFAKRVNEIMVADKLDWNAALAEAGRRHPEMAAAYRTAIPVVR